MKLSSTAAAVFSLAGTIGSANSAPIELGNGYSVDLQHARVIASHIEPKNKKTLFYVLDNHARGNGVSGVSNGLNPSGLETQRNSLPILDTLLNQGIKGGGIGFVHEGWDRKKGEKGEELVRRNIAGNLLLPHLKKTPQDPNPLDGGYSQALALAGKSMHQASELISAVHGTAGGKIEHLVPVASYDVQVRDDYSIHYAQNILSTDSVACQAIGLKSPHTVRSASLALFNGDTLDQQSKQCGCDGIRQYSTAITHFNQHRFIDTARAEIEAARSSKYDQVIINVGSGHAFYGLEHAKKLGLNYYVIAPYGVDVSTVWKNPVEIGRKIVERNTALCAGTSDRANKILDGLISGKIDELMARLKRSLDAIERRP
ncbi:MAG: hypothetical protein HHAS10_12250 [Candidatus Altimarinota bacterium]